MKIGLIIASISCFSLFGCIADNPSPVEPGETGSAQIRLPTVPTEALLKKSTSPIYRPNLFFKVTVTGPGMDSLDQLWPAYDFSGKSVTVEAIPAGYSRTFTGSIIKNGIVTHTGSYTADIEPNQSVYIPLVLHDIRTGRAEICMEVEGWPGSPECITIDTVWEECWLPIVEPIPEPEPVISVAGCWSFRGLKVRFPYDTLNLTSDPEYRQPNPGKLTLIQNGFIVTGSATLYDGDTYTINGYIEDSTLRATLIPASEIKTVIRYSEVQRTTFADTLPWFKHPVKPNLYMKINMERPSWNGEEANYLFGAFTDSTFTAVERPIMGERTECIEW